jgi:hypothetical protein
LNLFHADNIADLEPAGGDDLIGRELVRSYGADSSDLGRLRRSLSLLLRLYPRHSRHEQDSGENLYEMASHVNPILREDRTFGEGK